MSKRHCTRLIPLVSAFLLFGAGCMTAKFDLKDVPHPIVLNHNPFVGEVKEQRFRRIGYYRGKTSEEVVAGTVSSQTWVNSAQLNASEALGGRDDRAIVALSMEVWDYMFGFGIYQIGVQGEGELVELTEPAAQAGP